jgi:hypothetical protein
MAASHVGAHGGHLLIPLRDNCPQLHDFDMLSAASGRCTCKALDLKLKLS